ncbi:MULTISPECIES: HalOD1 output domain-containing protein [Halorussus]|uniref:HalOD1 output domain-containing protein n=1 Tax=Halorussus TaxID=1070314 RepID=UPI00209C7253|nr:HalOD1 output domain-containing protein [Halorussus vallis]USZ76002.1 hypothetical protein NGM07_01455 [Halorussus vallis]
MPVVHDYADGSGIYLKSNIDGSFVTFQATPSAENFLTDMGYTDVIDIAGIDDTLFDRPEANRNGTNSTVEFRYNDYKISVGADGWVTVSDRSGGSAVDGE